MGWFSQAVVCTTRSTSVPEAKVAEAQDVLQKLCDDDKMSTVASNATIPEDSDVETEEVAEDELLELELLAVRKSLFYCNFLLGGPRGSFPLLLGSGRPEETPQPTMHSAVAHPSASSWLPQATHWRRRR